MHFALSLALILSAGAALAASLHLVKRRRLNLVHLLAPAAAVAVGVIVLGRNPQPDAEPGLAVMLAVACLLPWAGPALCARAAGSA